MRRFYQEPRKRIRRKEPPRKLFPGDPLAQAAHDGGGTLIRPPLPSRAKWNAELARWAPGCGSPTTVVGTNGGEVPCGAVVNGKKVFCPYCPVNEDLGLGTSYSAEAFEAIKDWQKSTGAMYLGGPFFGRDFGAEGMVLFEIKNWSEGIQLSLIKTPVEFRGKGLASRALKELLSFADKHGVPVTGNVSRQEDEGPTLANPELMAWYKRHGFKSKRDHIKRLPVRESQAHLLVAWLLEGSKDFIMSQSSPQRWHVVFIKDKVRPWDYAQYDVGPEDGVGTYEEAIEGARIKLAKEVGWTRAKRDWCLHEVIKL